MISDIQKAIAGSENLETEARITPCGDYCSEPVNRFYQELNRKRFTIDAVDGVIESLTVSCNPAYLTLAWEPDVVWTQGV